MVLFLILLAIVVIIVFIGAAVIVHPVGIATILLLFVVIFTVDTCTKQCGSSREEQPVATHEKTMPVDSYIKEPIPPPGAERHREAVRMAMILVKHKIEDGTIKLSDEDKEIWEELKKEGKV